ncbi:MAG: hypothetical protein CME70_19265 [Halobacteriovorax sp.]|nr:hypothetical protein [Halobacteriovorax sp.]
MRITKRQLKRIIKEEKAKLVAETKVRRLVRRKLCENAPGNRQVTLEDARSMFPDAMMMLEKNLLNWLLGADHSPGDFETEVPTQNQLLSESEFFIVNGTLVHWWDDMNSPYSAGPDAYMMWDGGDWVDVDNSTLDAVYRIQ